MKNHKWVGGKLLQTNKKWSALKQSQREWIQELTRKEHAAYVGANNRLPMKKRKDEVIDTVYELLDERGVWIPYREFRGHVAAYIDKLNHKSPLFVPPAKKAEPPKPKTPKADVEDFPQEIQDIMKDKLASGIRRYILQSHRIPPNRIRDAEIKNILRGFNAKQWKPHGKRLQISDSLLALYDELRASVFSELGETGALPDKITGHDTKVIRNTVDVLQTERLTLRKMNGKDYKILKDTLSDPVVMAAWEHVYATKKEIMAWIIRQMGRYKHDLVGYYIAVDRESKQAVGQIGLMWNDIQGHRCLEVGYILNKAQWGKGYATEGAKALLEYGFNLFGVDKIYATIRPQNGRSIAVAERIGMTLEGEFIKKYNGKLMKHMIYSCSNNHKPMI